MQVDTNRQLGSSLREEFSLLVEHERAGTPLIYLDSASTTQKPLCVIEAVNRYLATANANVHRGVYALAERSTELFEQARSTVASFINAPAAHNIIFTHGTTEAINMVALGWARCRLHPGDLIVLTQGEHHSNLVPWQMLAKETGIELGFVPLTPEGTFDLEVYAALLNRSPRLVALSGMSNVTGYIPPYAQMLAQARATGARTLLDAAQLAAHRVLDVAALSVDFLALSSHKLYGPTGIGVLYGTDAALAETEPVFGGGEMVSYVSTDDFSLSPIPYRFEAGTPAIAQAIGFGAALKFVQNIGMASVGDYERELSTYARDQLLAIEGLSVLGYPQGAIEDSVERSGIFSMNLEGIHPHDVAQTLDERGICVRAGHHCALPLHHALGVPASFRASFGIYTTASDIDALCAALSAAKTLLGSR